MHNIKTMFSGFFSQITDSDVETSLIAPENAMLVPVLNGNGNRTFAPGMLGAGDFIRLPAFGWLNTTVPAAGNLTMKVYFPDEVPTVAFTTGAMALPVGVVTGYLWRLQVEISINFPPITYSCNGFFDFTPPPSVLTGPAPLFFRGQANESFDPTVAQSLDLTATLSIAAVGQTMTVLSTMIEYLRSP